MKILKWLKYLIYIVVIYFAVVGRGYLVNWYSAYAGQTYNYVNLRLLTIVLTTALIGALLGLDHLLIHRKRPGKWKVNWPKLILLGVPSLVFSMFNFLWSPVLINILNALMPLFRPAMYDGGFIAIFQLILGYAIITSFYKKEPVNAVNQDATETI